MSNETRYVRILPSAVESKIGQWYGHHIGAVLPVHHMNKHNDVDVYICYSPMYTHNTFMIEVEHTKEVFVYDEPRVLPAAEAQHTAKPMRVRVVKAKDSRMWYAKKIGHMYDVLAVAFSHYIVDYTGEENTTYYIAKSDCEVVQPEPEKMSDEQSAFLNRIAELEKRVAQLEGQLVFETQPPRDLVKQESNLDKSRRLYPKGTRFKSAQSGVECVSCGNFYEYENNITGSQGWVFYNGQWAEVVQPKQWRLKVDVPEWGLKNGDMSDLVRDSGEARFMPLGWLPASIMPYIADPVGEDGR